jgi:uncharacterized membrane protein YcaP (DUF421 family)
MDIVIRASLAYVFILLVTRAVGRRELSGLAPFDLILLVVLGDLIQQGVTQSDYSVVGLLLAGGTIAVWQAGLSLVNYRWKPARLLLEGEPVVIVQDGEVIERNMRRERLTLGEVEEEARLNSIASLKDVRWALLETNGKISFITK